MDKVTSIEQLKELISGIRNLRQGFVTNFYLDEVKHRAWIQTGKFLYAKHDDAVFLFFDHEAENIENYFTNLFYMATSEEVMLKHLKAYPEMYIYDLYILDIVGRKEICEPLVEKLKSIGGHDDAHVCRMTRMGEVNVELAVRGTNIHYADEVDLEQIESLLHIHFDEQLEQIPLRDELAQMVADKHILLCQREGKNAGILLFEHNATTLYLRYWLVLPECRNKGVGSELLRHFLWEGRETKRQILWVNQANENAIVRYEHYGFKQENMYDYIVKYC